MKRRTYSLLALLVLTSLVLYACVQTQIGVQSDEQEQTDGEDELIVGPAIKLERGPGDTQFGGGDEDEE